MLPIGRTVTGVRGLTIAALSFLVATSEMPAAQEQENQEEITAFANKLAPDLLRQVSRSKDQYLQQAANQIYRYAPDGVLTKEVVEFAILQHKAQQRASSLMPIMAYDLDGDFQISQEEIKTQSHLIKHHVRAQLALAQAEYDRDGDANLNLFELANYFDDQQEKQFRTDPLDQLFAFDYNKDGKVDVVEISAVVRAIDSDLLNSSKQRNVPSNNKAAARCEAPPVPKGHELVLLSGYEGPALSNIALNGQGTPTTAATFIVEPGETPLYVFATAYDPIVWKFEGATDRLKNVVIQPRTSQFGPGAAVSGVKAEAVTFVAPGSCVRKFVTKTGQKLNALSKELAARMSARVSYPIAAYTLDHIQVPSGLPSKEKQAQALRAYQEPKSFTIGEQSYQLDAKGMVALDDEGNPKPMPTQDRRTIREMMRFYRGGLIVFDPSELVAKTNVEPYVVLPDQAGLLQLIADNKIEVLSSGHYRVKESIPQYPAGLTGGHSVTFILADGVELPSGDPGHSTVILETTNACIIGNRCKQ
ncbi:EF-hand domain-containing protein [Roseibium sp. RKSG952]|uniref:EF-hand domain-containing protein n=1 Tax=Roseibium sp. RKSG952 TaxID=2529384 RepID=UPI001AD8E1B4|nr:hypothetical protein [Roseibium sp. RKSG952]